MTKLDQISVLEIFLLPQKGTVILVVRLTTEMRLEAQEKSPLRPQHLIPTLLAENAKMMAGLVLATAN
jgi:hypothetical protein